MASNDTHDETIQWLNYLQPEGLVLSPNVLRHSGLTPIRQTPLDTEDVVAALGLSSDHSPQDDKSFVLRNAWGFFETGLRWPASLVAGAPNGPELPDLSFAVPEQGTVLKPDLALLWNREPTDKAPVQALVSLYPELPPDDRKPFGENEWEASPHQRLERLLRETDVGVGILIARGTLRLIYAPRGETAGWISWPLAALGRVEGRPMLAGLKVALGREAFFVGEPTQRLRPLLRASREAQNEVSEKLSGQVLAALYELLRGIHQAAPDEIETLAEQQPHHLYEGLLTCLMRLVFLLYAEDRDLLPTHTEDGLKALWESGYSIKTLYARLLADQAVNPDTMDQRRGAWGQLLSVFRIIHAGHPDWVAARGGKLFDPDAFPFLEGRGPQSTMLDGKVMPVSDGMVLRILDGLMTIDGRGMAGERIRERLSYRSLDVESIGSVYETVMGFTAKRATEPMIAVRDEKKLPNFIGLETLLAEKPSDRQKWLKEQSVKLSAKQNAAVKDAADVEALIAAFGSAVDERASPKATAIGIGTPYLQPTDERRRSGSHYTPRSLTEPIVRHALEPAFERIGADASPEAVLSLKVCDPACGSGAFLVEACRQLGARLEQAWDMHKAEKPGIPADEDEVIHARRLVAQRCLYGVDRNPMAVDLARLSLWLATLAREHEFTFLDHAIKAGDSLVGLTRDQIAAVHWDEGKGVRLLGQLIKEELDRAYVGREAIRTAPDDVTRMVQEARHNRVDADVEPARQVGDAVIAAFFSADRPRARAEALSEVENWISGHLPPLWDKVASAAKRLRVEQGWRPFHWQVEFPEVFMRDNPGFDAIVGNPPFAGKNTISAASGPRYLPWLQQVHEGAHGNSDLVAHFFRRAFVLLRRGGAFGLIATNTVGQGDTRQSGLTNILSSGGQIYRAVRRYKWPNSGAAVTVSIVHVVKNSSRAAFINDSVVERISAYLLPGRLDVSPSALASNEDIAFIGTLPLGVGFNFDDDGAAKGECASVDDMRRLLENEPRNALRVFPFIGGDDLNRSPTHESGRYIIDFANMPLARDPTLRSWAAMTFEQKQRCLLSGVVPTDYPEDVASDWPELLGLVERHVRPGREKQNDAFGKRYWWRFLRTRPALYSAIKEIDRVLVTPRVSTGLHFTFLGKGAIYNEKIVVFSSDKSSNLAIFQSRAHEIWVRTFTSTLEDRLNYSPTDCLQNFPLPRPAEGNSMLEAIGQTYHDYRAELMVAANEGMTKTYNRFHKESETGPAIQRLRELHDEMDRAVLRAYGWDDLADTLKPEFLTAETEDDHTYQGRYFWSAAQRDQVLSRLLALNAERYEEELKAGLHEKGKKRVRSDDDEDSTFE